MKSEAPTHRNCRSCRFFCDAAPPGLRLRADGYYLRRQCDVRPTDQACALAVSFPQRYFNPGERSISAGSNGR